MGTTVQIRGACGGLASELTDAFIHLPCGLFFPIEPDLVHETPLPVLSVTGRHKKHHRLLEGYSNSLFFSRKNARRSGDYLITCCLFQSPKSMFLLALISVFSDMTTTITPNKYLLVSGPRRCRQARALMRTIAIQKSGSPDLTRSVMALVGLKAAPRVQIRGRIGPLSTLVQGRPTGSDRRRCRIFLLSYPRNQSAHEPICMWA